MRSNYISEAFPKFLAEIWVYYRLDYALIACVGGNLDGAFCNLQPFEHKVGKHNLIVQWDIGYVDRRDKG